MVIHSSNNGSLHVGLLRTPGTQDKGMCSFVITEGGFCPSSKIITFSSHSLPLTLHLGMLFLLFKILFLLQCLPKSSTPLVSSVGDPC